MKNEIILYQSNELSEHIEVHVDGDTVWLSLNQMAQLFNRDKSVISRHLRNIYQEGELKHEGTVAKNATVQMEAGRQVTREIEYYNLDAIISVGYRVNSKQGTLFRIWATNVLKSYLLQGYVFNKRLEKMENNFDNLSKEVSQISLQLKTTILPNQGVFFDGQIFDAYNLASQIIRSARKEIILIDNYVDETTLTHLSKKAEHVTVRIMTKNVDKQLLLDIKKANEQYGGFKAEVFTLSHDRFIIIDRKQLYHIGASLKDLGKKWFAFSRMDSITELVLKQLQQ